MTIYRVHSQNYITINKFICEDNRLSWKAKGIWLYAFSRPNNCDFNLNDFLSYSTDEIDSVIGGLNELEKYGYITKNEKNYNEKNSTDWIFREIPNTEFDEVNNE